MQFHQKSIKRSHREHLDWYSHAHPVSFFPHASPTSQVVAGISVFFICTSVISFCLKTLPGLRVEIPLTFNHTTSRNLSDIYQALPSTTEANLITTTTTQRPTHGGGLLNRYAVCTFEYSPLRACLFWALCVIGLLRAFAPRSRKWENIFIKLTVLTATLDTDPIF